MSTVIAPNWNSFACIAFLDCAKAFKAIFGGVRRGACRFQILVIWGPYDFPVLVACQGQAKNLKNANVIGS